EQIAKLLKVDALPDPETLSDPFHGEMLNSIRTIRYIQDQNGEMGCHRYIISNSQSAVHILSVYQLAKLELGRDGKLNLDIVRLFETIDDLLHAPGIDRKRKRLDSSHAKISD